MKMNISETICQVDIFKNNVWLTVASSISYGLGILVAASWICEIWGDFSISQKVWTIFSILKAWNKILVNNSCNGVNQKLTKIYFYLDGDLGICYCWDTIISSMGSARRFWLLFLEQSNIKLTHLYDVSFTQFDNCLQILCSCQKINSRDERKFLFKSCYCSYSVDFMDCE